MKQYKATHATNTLIIDESMLTNDHVVEVLSLLNKNGFALGSGHEKIEITYNGEDYAFRGIPYYGHSGQIIHFEQI